MLPTFTSVVSARGRFKAGGVTFDIGVGTFSFYCETFSKLGYRTVAVEPMPVEELKQLCARHKIELVESAVSDIDGTVTLYVGSYEGAENYNLNSLQADWWGGSANARQVSSVTLPTLLMQVGASKITCMKIDVEGSERTIMSQFADLAQSQIPSIVMFEYGGGGQRQAGKAGWTEEYLTATLDCLGILKQCGFEQIVLVDSAIPSGEIMNLQEVSLTGDALFSPAADYGNIIAFRQYHPNIQTIADICRQYAEDNVVTASYFTRLANLARHFVKKL